MQVKITNQFPHASVPITIEILVYADMLMVWIGLVVHVMVQLELGWAASQCLSMAGKSSVSQG